MKKILLLLLVGVVLYACSSTKNAVYKESDFEIRFGHLGGFTNRPMEYLINGDRNIFKVEPDSVVFVNRISKKEFESIQCSLQELGFEAMQLNVPGNMTHFVKVKTPEYENKVIWYEYSGNSDIEELYNILLTTLD
ncbi:MAG: hypothetical protein K9H26_00530 [Prolixibacteraceae bacterium]|nr:hypothetical protein [Prolixibacteraceae bacterium]